MFTLDGSVKKGSFPKEIMAMISKVTLNQFSSGYVEVVKRSVCTALKMNTIGTKSARSIHALQPPSDVSPVLLCFLCV